MNKARNGLFKNKYFIVFYGEDDDTYIAGFDNIKEICLYKGIQPTPQNMNALQVKLYRALKRQDHNTCMLNGSKMHVYLIEHDL